MLRKAILAIGSAAAALASAGAISPAVAAPAPAQAESVDPAALAAARELLIATNFNEQMEATATQTIDQTLVTMIRQFEQERGSAFPPALVVEMRTILQEHNASVMAALRPTALDDAALIYARHFTTAEIRELQALQTHPVMIKAQRIAPQLLAELSQIGIAEAARQSGSLEQRIREAVDNWLSRNPPAERNGSP